MKWTVYEYNSLFANVREYEKGDEEDGALVGVYPSKREAVQKAKAYMRKTIDDIKEHIRNMK